LPPYFLLDARAGRNTGCGPSASRSSGSSYRSRWHSQRWRPGSPVMAQCKPGRPGCGRWRGSRARQQPRASV